MVYGFSCLLCHFNSFAVGYTDDRIENPVDNMPCAVVSLPLHGSLPFVYWWESPLIIDSFLVKGVRTNHEAPRTSGLMFRMLYIKAQREKLLCR